MDETAEWMAFLDRFFAETEITRWGDGAPETLNQTYKSYPRLPRRKLPKPVFEGGGTFAEVLARRKSAQAFTADFVALADLSTLLAAVGLRTREESAPAARRMYPSAGAKYSTEVYVAVQRCEGLDAGLYHYAPREHVLEELWKRDLTDEIARATADSRLLDASAVVIVSMVCGRVAEKYGRRAIRYGLIEAGHVAQNLGLAAAALGLGLYEIGGFVDRDVARLLDIDPGKEQPILLVAVGREASTHVE